MLRRFFAIFVFSFVLAIGSAHADDAQYADKLDTVVPGMGQKTYVDLLGQIFKDVRPNEGGYLLENPVSMIPLMDDPDNEQPRAVTIQSVSTLEIKAEGKKRLVMLLDAPEAMETMIGYAIIAIYNIDTEAKLVTVNGVSFDRITGFAANAKITLNSDNDAFFVYSEHFNSSQTYGSHVLFSALKGEIEKIDSIFTISDRFCGYSRADSVSFTPVKNELFNDINVVATEKITHEGEDEDGCLAEPRPELGIRTFTRLLRWDAKAEKYTAIQSDIEKLEAESENRP